MYETFRKIAGSLPSPVVGVLRYRREYLYMKGCRNYDKDSPSVIFFTVHKCASTLIRRILNDINSRYLFLTPLNLAGYYWDAMGGNFYSRHKDDTKNILCDTGVLFSPFRQYVDISHLQKTHILVMLRDPRDRIVSGYYSVIKTHRPPANPISKEAFVLRRSQMGSLDINEYALAVSDRVREIYEAYRSNIPRDWVVTYEDMWSDFDSWIYSVGKILGINLSSSDVDRYRRMADLREDRVEDQRLHIRRGVPGDYIDKLSPEVVEQLTERFQDVLGWLYDSN